MSERVRGALRSAVAIRARGRCEYCGMPDDVLPIPHEPDHVVAAQHRGQTRLDNLAYTCFRCNRYKGPNLASIDPQTGIVTQLFNPRTDVWGQHFAWDAAEIMPLSAIGRATQAPLRFNDPERISLRTQLIQQGRYFHPSS